MKHYLLVLSLAVLVAGCASVGRQVDPNKLSLIKKGESTQADVERLIGKPTSVSVVDGPDGKETVLEYHYAFAHVRGETFIPIIESFAGGMNVDHQWHYITLGNDGLVKIIKTTTGNDAARMNLSAQPPNSDARPPQSLKSPRDN